MKILTERDLIRDVAKRWADQYRDYGGTHPEEKATIGKLLAKLDPERAAAKDVERIIGNDTWTSFDCQECQATALRKIVRFEDGWESSGTWDICIPCLRRAYRKVT